MSSTRQCDVENDYVKSKSVDKLLYATDHDCCTIYQKDFDAVYKSTFNNCSFRTKAKFKATGFLLTNKNAAQFISCNFSDGIAVDFSDYGGDEDSYFGGARTLLPRYVTEGKDESGHHTRVHENGWKISGEIHEDYFVWVNEFSAEHPEYGKVWGDFESKVYADTPESLRVFIKEFPYDEWDYGDI